MSQNAIRKCLLTTAIVLCTVGSCHAADRGCEASPVLFFYQGSLFRTAQEGKPVEVAKGAKSPGSLLWSTDCSHYAYRDDGSLWIAAPERSPRRAPVSGRVIGYVWNPIGDSIAVMAERARCQSEKGSTSQAAYRPDVFLVLLRDGSVREITEDCRTEPFGWSSDGKRLLLKREVSGPVPCDLSDPSCAHADLIIWDGGSNSEKVLIRAHQLRLKKYGDVNAFVWWDARRGVIYTWNLAFPIGGVGFLLATDANSGKVLWSRPCRSARLLGDSLLGIVDREWNKATELNEYEPLILEPSGNVSRRFPHIPSYFPGDNWSPDARYIAWSSDEESENSSVNFATADKAQAWQYSLPSGIELCDSVWTPQNLVAVYAFEKELGSGQLKLFLWLLDPAKKVGRKIFEAEQSFDSSVTDPRDAACGSWMNSPPIVLGDWTR